MAGAGYKLFNTGDVLTAAQVNTYLMEQTVMVFADATARTTALSGVLAEGMVTYLKSTDVLEVYNGSAWVGATGDITEVQAGTGISVTSGTGPIPVVTNTIATAFDAKGDLVAGTGADTFSKLSVGTNNFFLQANSATSTGLDWAGSYTTFTPTYTSLTVGNGTNTGKYLQIGKLVHVTTQFIFGSTSSITGSPVRHNFPITAANSQNQIIGQAYILDAGTQDYPGFLIKAGTDNCLISVSNSAGTYANLASMSSTIPFTWTTNDQISLSYVYEVA